MSNLNINLPESLRRRAETLAQDDGVPLDQFIATALAEKVAVLDADSYIRARVRRVEVARSSKKCSPRFRTLNRKPCDLLSPKTAD
jgi:hypothetical protein